MQQGENPRATVIKNAGQDQYILQQVLKQIPPIEQITFDLLIELFDRCCQIREQPQFIQALFNKNTIYEEFVMWLFQPMQMAQKRLNNPNKLPSGQWKKKYPFACMQIAKQNNSFYIQLYLKAYFDQSALSIWFDFLKQSNQETLSTSLGYFNQIMMPFIKYQFSDSTQICEKLADSCDEDILMSSSEIVREQTPLEKQRQQISIEKKRTFLQQQITILKIFSDELFTYIFDYLQNQPIFKFIHNLILVSLQQNDLKRSKKIFEAFLNRSLQITIMNKQDQFIHQSQIQNGPLMDICSEYILEILKQIQTNANTQKNYRVIFFVDSMIRVHLIDVFIQRIQSSFLMTKQSNQQKLTSSMDFTSIVAEQQIVEYYLNALSYFIKIYSKMIKTNKTQEDIERQSKYYGDEEINEEEELSGQGKVMKQFSVQIKQIFAKLNSLSTLVKKNQPRSLPFSSGQNIKPVTLCKYQFFQLIYNCLLLSRQYPQEFVIDTQKINIFSIIERYLQQNRWNNLTHQILQKITYLLIKSNKKFFRTKQMSKNNMADQFLNSIIQSFTNKKYIFLNSLRFTTQGNLHALYNIAKGIISELKQSHKLANLIHEFEYYKKFVVDDLQQYQTRTLEIKYPADEEDMRKSQCLEQNDQIKLWVDELNVGQIIKKIQLVSKWPVKESRRKHGSFIHRSLSYMSDELLSSNMLLATAQKGKHMPAPSQQLLNTEEDYQLNPDNMTTLKQKCKLFNTMQPSLRQNTKSQIQGGSAKKSNFMQTNFIKNSIRKIQSKQIQLKQQQSPPKQGKGLFSSNFNKKNTNKSDSIEQRQEQTSLVLTYHSPSKQQDQVFNINVFNTEDGKLKKNVSISSKEEKPLKPSFSRSQQISNMKKSL